MAIEFNCPYCSAVIRVPDNAAGGKGRCPKCSTRLSVPKVSAPKASAPNVAAPRRSAPPPGEPGILFAAPPAEESQFKLTDAGPAVDDSPSIAFAESGLDGPREPDPAAPFEFPDASEPEAAEPTDVTVRTPIRPKRSLARTLGRGLWLIPVLLGLILAAGFGWFAWQEYGSERLIGEFTAETADELDLPPLLIEKFSIKQPSEDVQAVLIDLEKSPVPLTSSLMQVQFRGSSRGVLVQLNAGQATRFYRVEVGDNKPLAKYLGKHAADFEQRRMTEIEREATAFAIEYRKVIAKKADQNSLKDFRNTLALPALVRGLGHQIVATHGRTIYPCVYEDREGALYFLLPPDAKSFEISGREDGNRNVLFPGRYMVQVAGMMKVPAKKDDATGTSKDKKNKPVRVFKRSDEPGEKMDSEKMDSKADADMKKSG